MKDDKKVIKDCLKGSHQAFARLVDKYKSFVCSIAYCMTGNIDSSEDIAQDVFISVWKDLPQLSDYGKFKNWLRSITHNKTCSYLKSDIKHSAVDIDSVPVAAPDKKQNEDNDLIWQTLETLPDQYREVMVLYYRHEKSAKQVAELMGISADAVRQRLSRGRQMIRERIEDRLEAGLRNSAPDKKFTASVIAAISSIPIGVAVSEATAAASVSASVPFVATLQTIMATTAAKVATVAIIAAAAIATGLILSNNEKSQPIQKTETIQPITATDSSPVETHFNASENLPQPIVTPTPQQSQQSPEEQPATETKQPTESPAATEETTDAFTPRGVLSGLITDKETGEPVIDAQISLALPNGETATTHVDENGFYFFDKLPQYGNCELGIESKEYVGLKTCYRNKRSLNISPETQTVHHIQLEKACMLELEAVDEQGKPVKDVIAAITDTSSVIGSIITDNGSKKTGDDCRIVLGGIKPSNNAYNLSMRHSGTDPNSHSTTCDYVFISRQIVLNDPEIIKYVKIVMKKGIDVNGRLLYSNGMPANDLKISAEPKWKPYTRFCYPRIEVRSDGTFTLKHVEPGINDILTVRDREEKVISTMPLKEGDFLDLTIPYEDPSKLVEFTGKIILEGDCEVRYINIWGYSSVNVFRRQIDVPDDSKEFDFNIDNIKSGVYWIEISGENVQLATQGNVTIPCDEFVKRLKCIPKVNVSGIVIDHASQTPIKNFRILPHFTGLRKSYVVEYNWIDYADAIDGKFQADFNEEGVYQFFVDSDGFAPKIVDLDTTKSNEFTAELITGNTLQGKVIDSDGLAVKNVKLIPFTKNGRYDGYDVNNKIFFTDKFSSTTDDEGCFSLNNLPENSETIKIMHPDYAERVMDVRLPDVINDIVITLFRGGTIEGYVYDNNGNARTNFPLVLNDKATNTEVPNIFSTMTTTTGNDGYYKFENLPEGFWYIRHPSDSRINGTCRNSILVSEDKTIRLDFGGEFFLTGRILVNGLPLAHANIAVVETLPYHVSSFMNNGNTDVDGDFTFSGIVAGRKKLLYEIPEANLSRWIIISEFDTGGDDYDLGDIFVDTVDIEAVIKSDYDTDIQLCLLAEDFGYMSTINETQMILTDTGTFATKNVTPGRYVLRLCRGKERALFLHEINVPVTGELFSFDVQLPHATSSVYGKLASDKKDIMCIKDDLTFMCGVRGGKDGYYRLNNIPAGTYKIENSLNKIAIAAFELKDNESLELDLDGLLQVDCRAAYAKLIVLDHVTQRIVDDYYAYFESGNAKYEVTRNGLLVGPADNYKLYVNCEGYKPHLQTVMLNNYDRADISSIIVILERE